MRFLLGLPNILKFFMYIPDRINRFLIVAFTIIVSIIEPAGQKNTKIVQPSFLEIALSVQIFINHTLYNGYITS